jgi:hypothetical protein
LGNKRSKRLPLDYYAEEERFLVRIPEELGELAVMLEPTDVAEKAVISVFEIQRRMV